MIFHHRNKRKEKEGEIKLATSSETQAGNCVSAKETQNPQPGPWHMRAILHARQAILAGILVQTGIGSVFVFSLLFKRRLAEFFL
jgi:hypothetical protein